MHVLTSIIDPAENGIGLDDVLIWVTLVVTVVGAWAAADRWIDKRRETKRIAARDQLTATIREIVTDATKPIQPFANGGKSLPDVIDRVDVVIERQTDVIRDVRAIRERLDSHIDDHNQRKG